MRTGLGDGLSPPQAFIKILQRRHAAVKAKNLITEEPIAHGHGFVIIKTNDSGHRHGIILVYNTSYKLGLRTTLQNVFSLAYHEWRGAISYSINTRPRPRQDTKIRKQQMSVRCGMVTQRENTEHEIRCKTPPEQGVGEMSPRAV